LEKGESDTLSMDLAASIRSQIPEVRQDAIKRAERLKLSVLLPVIQTQLKLEDDPKVRETASCALIVLGADSNTALNLLAQEDASTKRGAMIGSLRSSAENKKTKAYERLELLARSDSNTERVEASELIAESTNPALWEVLLPLLNDEDLNVKKSALRSATKIRRAELYSSIIPALGSPQTRSLAFNALNRWRERCPASHYCIA
jgi:HEAT repeat protein